MSTKTSVLLKLNPLDNVAIAKQNLQPGDHIFNQDIDLHEIWVKQDIPAGHKLALETIHEGEGILRYGERIGVASKQIDVGEHVHTHNVQSVVYDQDYYFGKSDDDKGSIQDVDRLYPTDHVGQQRNFQGFLRSDGRVGTRNYIAVIASVQCAAQVCSRIASHFNSDYLDNFPNVDGVIALTHNGGCGQTDYRLLRRTLTGMARHPNVASVVMVGLGCEGNQLDAIWSERQSTGVNIIDQPICLEIQALGGSQKTIRAGIDAVEALLPKANKAQRSSQPLSKLVMALECGGSDSWSGITANPLVGCLSDRVVEQGGTVVMAETPEVFGAEHLLLRRAISPEVRGRFIEKLTWWRDYVIRINASLEDNPSPGNKAGGLTNICEKSLGAIVKSGSSVMREVYNYAETIREPGFVFMDSPGNDPVSVTGMVAGGCNLVLFTTGRGSVFGYKPAPSLKISTNTTTFLRMMDDMDFNAGRILDEEISLDILATKLLEMVVATASGEKTKSELLGLGEIEFVPWFTEGFV